MFGLGIQELLIIALIILIFIVFGTKKLPGIGKGLGGAVREFRNIENQLTGSGSKKVNSKKAQAEKDESGPSIEAMVTKNIMRQIPGVRKVMNIKDKVDRVRDIIK